MSLPTDGRILGLSPRARRFVAPVFIAVVLVITIGSYMNRSDDNAADSSSGPIVGGDLHAVGQLGDRLFVGGHGGAGYRVSTGGWTQIDSLDDKDVMGWAASATTFLAGGHQGLYASTDDGSTFRQVPNLPVSDVHGLGASGDRVYLASPQAGVLVSTDGGKTFERRSTAGQDFMGTIWVDPTNPDIAIAPPMQDGAVETRDGGSTWTRLGSGMGSMAVAVDDTGGNLLALGMDGAQESSDGGTTWTSVDVPSASSAASYTSEGELVVAVLSGDRAAVYQQVGGAWNPLA